MKKTTLGLFLLLFLCNVASFAQEKETEEEKPKTDLNVEDHVQKLIDNYLRESKALGIHFDSRMDYSFSNEEVKGEGSKGAFNFHTAKLVYSGEIYNGVRYLIRHRLNKSQEGGSFRDNTGGALDFAFLELDAGDNWTFTIGKQATAFGTYEINYNIADVYLSSSINNTIAVYNTGVRVAYKKANQTFNLQLINSNSPQFTIPKYKDKSYGGLFLWEGNLFDGFLQTRYGVGAFQQDAKKYNAWYTFGTQINTDKLTVELDWYNGRRNMFAGYTDIDGNELDTSVNDQSVAILLRYIVGDFRPEIKAVWDERKDKLNDNTYFTQKGVQAALEYFPFHVEELKDLRFHVAYMYRHVDSKNPNVNPDQHTVLAGLRWFFKIK